MSITNISEPNSTAGASKLSSTARMLAAFLDIETKMEMLSTKLGDLLAGKNIEISKDSCAKALAITDARINLRETADKCASIIESIQSTQEQRDLIAQYKNETQNPDAIENKLQDIKNQLGNAKQELDTLSTYVDQSRKGISNIVKSGFAQLKQERIIDQLHQVNRQRLATLGIIEKRGGNYKDLKNTIEERVSLKLLNLSELSKKITMQTNALYSELQTALDNAGNSNIKYEMFSKATTTTPTAPADRSVITPSAAGGSTSPAA